MSAATAQPPAIPPRPSRSREEASAPMDRSRPTNLRLQRSISFNHDRFAPSPLNESPFLKSPRSPQAGARNGQNGDPIPRSTSVELPSLGEEGKEYASLAEELNEERESASFKLTRTVADDLKLHAPKPSLPAASAKQRVMTVTHTDSERAASFGIGRPSSVEDLGPAAPSNRSLKKKASTVSQLSTASSYVDDEHGIPEIGQQVPMYPNAGDVQAPSPAPAAAEGLKGRHHARKTSARGNLPPGSYGLHGHGVAPQDKLEKAYYQKHPDLLKKEHVPHHYDRPNDFSMSRDDLNKIVRDTASRGSGLGVKNYAGTPSDQVGWQALEESASRVTSPGISSGLGPASTVSDSDKESRRRSAAGDVIHVDEPSRRRSVMFSDSESANGEQPERPYTAPILADDEVATDPTPYSQPAVEPPSVEIEEPSSRPTSRPTSLRKEPLFELRSTPLEDVDEYEPLFKDDEKPEAPKSAKEEKLKNKHVQRFPSADIWEDAPSSVFYTAEVSTPQLFDEEDKPSPAVAPPPREGETPAQAFARHHEELAEKEAREHGGEGFIPPRSTQKPLWAQHQKHLIGEASASRPAMQQRFPSRDVWEDAPESLILETTVSTPQQDEAAAHDSETPTVQFTNVQDLSQVVDRVSGDILIVTDVSPSNFAQIERARETFRRKVRFRRYHADSCTLVMTIPTALHEQLHCSLYSGRFMRQLFQRGLDETWSSMDSPGRHPGADGGEGDSTGGPIPDRGGPDAWPTLVIEAGDSESLRQLHTDMAWWFSASNHGVKIVIIAKFDHRQREIILEKWEEEASTEAAALQQGGMLQPAMRQRIAISRDQTTDPASYRVTRGALVLGFRLLFLRDPGPDEGDVIINAQDLQWYAERVWSQVRD